MRFLFISADKNVGVEEVRRTGEAGFFAKGSFDETDPRKIQEMSNLVVDKTIVDNFCFVSSPDDIIEAIERVLVCWCDTCGTRNPFIP